MNGAENTTVWGVPGKRMSVLLEALMNGKKVNIWTGPSNERTIDEDATQAAAAMMEKIGDEFRSWLWEDEQRRIAMEELFNQEFNAYVTPEYNGRALTINGINPKFKLKTHQSSAIQRILESGGNTLLAHRVGAGKTLEMASAAMKLKELGIVKKPMFVVPNNVVAQWGKEFKDYFPASTILVVGDKDMSPAERMTTINKIKNNDYDAVILAYTKFESIPTTKEWRAEFYQEQIDDTLFAMNQEKQMNSKNEKGFTIKQLEKTRDALIKTLKELETEHDEDGAMFEDLGIDSIYVDEAHNFKNLFFTSRMHNVSGIGDPKGSARSFDLYTKIRYLQKLNGGRGVVFATATPAMNSLTEMYTMQRYLQPDLMKQLNIENFDAWAKMFGEVVNELEINPTGTGYRVKEFDE